MLRVGLVALALSAASLQVAAQSERVWFRWRTVSLPNRVTRVVGHDSFFFFTTAAWAVDDPEPDIVPQTFEVKHRPSDPSLLSDGYFFIAPLTWQMGYGPKIYDSTGLLIWDGNYTSGAIAQQFGVCNYGGEQGQHLCWHEASKLGIDQKVADPSGLQDANRIFDNTYTQVGPDYSSTGDIKGNPDAHEFNLLGDSFLQVVYPRKLMDLSQWTGPEVGMIQDSCFQEISVATGEPIYSWCYLDHLDLETEIYVKSDKQTNFTTEFGGYGITFSPWDFYHLNSVDKNADGDYLLSGRHADQLMLLAGPNSTKGEPGQPIWRLGGPSNEFEFVGGWSFTRQHHARFVSCDDNEVVLTVFDNSWEGESHFPSSNRSSGKLISLNTNDMTATLLQEYPQPNGQLSRSGGSVQIQDNGNVVIGWGFIREVSEFTHDGELLYHAEINNINKNILRGWGYRNFKSPWHAIPAHPPKLLTYTQDCNKSEAAPLAAYVSWNGATEVADWRFFTSDYPDGPWTEGVTIKKNNFETSARIADVYHPYVAVQALDKDGTILSHTTTTTFVPNDEASEGCDETGCYMRKYFTLPEEFSRQGECIRAAQVTLRRGERFLAFGAVALLCALAIGWVSRPLVTRLWKSSTSSGDYRYSRVGDPSAGKSIV